ncbi:unnamed protein product, partial [marine sediment metagenome]
KPGKETKPTTTTITPKIRLAIRPKTYKGMDGFTVKGQYTLSQLRDIYNQKSPQSKLMDNSRSHQITINPEHPTTKRWAKDQGVADVLGIDNPPNITKPTRSTGKITYQTGKGVKPR